MPKRDEIAGIEERILLVGFYDLTRYMDWSGQRSPAALLELMAGYFDLTARILSNAGGTFVKAIGDAGFAVFPAEIVDAGVGAFLAAKRDGDAWLAARGIASEAQVRLDLGPIAVGRVAGRPDFYGAAVNRAAMLRGGAVVVSAEVHRRLGPALRGRFAPAADGDVHVLA